MAPVCWTRHQFCTFVLCTIIPCQCTSVKSVMMMRCGARFSRGFSRFGMQASDVAKSRTVHNNKARESRRIKVVSLLKRILEKKDRRRQLGFSVVYPIKSYLISNALTQAIVSGADRHKRQKLEKLVILLISRKLSSFLFCKCLVT